MKTLAAGPNWVRQIGGVYEVEDQEARDLVSGRYAVLIEEVQQPEETKETTRPKKAGKKSRKKAEKRP